MPGTEERERADRLSSKVYIKGVVLGGSRTYLNLGRQSVTALVA